METVICNLCGSAKSIELFETSERWFGFAGKYHIVHCVQCGLIYLNPRPTEQEMTKFYPDNNYYAYTSSGPKSRILGVFNKILEAAASSHYTGYQYIRKRAVGRKILDVGCGNGDYLLWLQEHGWEAQGVEINKRACQNAWDKKLKVYNGTLLESNLPSNYFDVVRLWHVLEHLHDPQATLNEAYRILAPRGILIVSTPNVDSIQFKLFRQNWVRLDVPRHLYCFSRKTLCQIINKAGLKIAKTVFYSGQDGFAGSLQLLFLNEPVGTKRDMNGPLWLRLLFYPPALIMDKLVRHGDCIAVTAYKLDTN